MPITKKERLDKLLVERGFAQSRERARAFILEGRVLVNGRRIDKTGHAVPVAAKIELKGEDIPYVSRGGLKLEGAIKSFGITVEGLTVLDVGASTGGFTDCLLQHGARRVYAVDVGYGQLAWKLRQDTRVVSLERTNIRYMDKSRIPEPVQLAVVDTSFISLDKVLPRITDIIEDHGVIVALIKPQFEVGRGEVGKGGVVRDPKKQAGAVDRITRAARELGLKVLGVEESPLLGPKGNREFFIYLSKQAYHPASANDSE
ncbi:MAG: TlyA family RNA methyltransferase [Deltaproteobacteria bacterium]|nr:TlyA family RNA methyltransferase [Deltaproteobacteria bacterium]MBW2308162.1 TlyA family RNA methyltransferase [Deltaproteobacteria bacterium]